MSAADDDDKIGNATPKDLELIAMGALARDANKGSTVAAKALMNNLQRREERKAADRRGRDLDRLIRKGDDDSLRLVCEILGKVGASDRECYVLLGREMTPVEQACYERGEVLRSITARQSAIDRDLADGEISVVGVHG